MGRNRWWVVFSSVLALIAGNAVINVYAAGIFVKPLAQELGFGRGVISSAIALANIVQAVTIPFAGRLMDRYGVRAVVLPGIVLFALATAARSLLTTSTALLFFVYAVSGFVGSAHSNTAYSKFVAGHFDTQRGLALGISLSGIGLGTALIPQFSAVLLKHFGWRVGFLGLAGAVLILAFIPMAIFCREPASVSTLDRRGRAASQAALAGLTFSEALRTWRLWALTIIFFLATVAINGSIIHVVPMLTDRGLSLAAATAALSASGFALIGGRLLSGYLLDRIFAPYIGMFFLVLPVTGLAILALGALGPWPVIGTVMLGMGMGAEIDLLAYVIGCYFGLRAFGTLHGFIFGVSVIANAVGVSLLGWCFQVLKSYTAGFMLFEILLVVACILFATLGAYRFPPRGKKQLTEKEPALA
jgi:MFS family permease